MQNTRIYSLFAGLLLTLMFALMFGSAKDESAIMDEMPHIPAGYSYLTEQDMRLNPEHPPLVKDLAAIPLLFLDLNFPANSKYWTDEINGQWALGAEFLYESGNNPDRILRYARLPLMLLTVILGWMFYLWTTRRYGYNVGLLALLFYATSPTFLAHGRYVTTDIGATFGFFIGLAVFLKFLDKLGAQSPDRNKYLVIAGLGFGVAQLCKFSLFLLVPIYAVLGTLWIIAHKWDDLKNFYTTREKILTLLKDWIKMVGYIFIIGMIGILVISFVYAFHVWNYPAERQLSDMQTTLKTFGTRPLVDLTIYMASVPILRPLGQYLFGLLMVVQRAAGGNTTYFLGEVSNLGWWYYFPVAYLLKEQLALHLLTLWVLLLGIWNLWNAKEKTMTAVMEWVRDNFTLVAAGIFIFIYWSQSMKSILNIGVRHILPTFPFIYLLVSWRLVKWLQSYPTHDPQNIHELLRGIYERYIAVAPRYLTMGIFILWLAIEAVFTYPYYLTYYNELAGGPRDGYKYIVDSNYDWGQDLKRLAMFADDTGIKKINLDYFGGGSPRYYLGDKFTPWWSAKGAPQKGEWFAISATFRQGAFGKPIPSLSVQPEDSYSWLRDKEPFARIGNSIFVYQF
jgi:hypothetical protein